MDIELTPNSIDNIEHDILNKIKMDNKFIKIEIDKNNYNLITKIKISNNITFIGIIKTDIYDLYIWNEIINNITLIGLQDMPIKSWYKIKKETELKTIIDYFNNKDKIYYNCHRFYINTNIDFMTLLNYIKNSDYTLKNIYLDEKDEVNKINNDKMTDIDSANLTYMLTKSEIDEFYVYTKYSNSKLKFENHKGYIIVEINYNQLKLRNRYNPFDKFLPFDISLILNIFDLKSINDILNKKELEIFEIDICVLLAKDKKNLNKLKIKLNDIKKEHSEINEYIDNVIDRIKSDEIFIQIENDGIFRSFENSVDILLKTVFERLNENKCIDFTYINEILKYKVNNIFYSRLL